MLELTKLPVFCQLGHTGNLVYFLKTLNQQQTEYSEEGFWNYTLFSSESKQSLPEYCFYTIKPDLLKADRLCYCIIQRFGKKYILVIVRGRALLENLTDDAIA